MFDLVLSGFSLILILENLTSGLKARTQLGGEVGGGGGAGGVDQKRTGAYKGGRGV